MEPQDVLQHLLEVEKQASSLVLDAQAEADRRIAEYEGQCKERFEAAYHTRIAEIEKEYSEHIERIKKQYTAELAAYKKELDGQAVEYREFSLLMDQLVFGSR